jgi:hypothetical protein
VHSYRVFDVGVDSPFELPELDASGVAHPNAWKVEAFSSTPPATTLEPTGTDTVYGSVQVRSFVSSGLARLTFDDTGTFDLDPSRRAIRWYSGPDAQIAAVRADLLGRVLAMAVHHEGALGLHASAVSIGDGVVAFLGPKRAGKSTLAMALVRRGARLVTDDTLVVRLEGRRALAAPGVQRVRLWPDSARAVGVAASGGERAKPTIDDLGIESREDVVKPLIACYVLHPVPDESPVARRRLSEVHAAVAGVSCSKLAGLAGGRLAGDVLDRSTRLARAVPMYAADVPRAFAHLDRVADAVLAWHRSSAPNVATVR